MTDAERADKIRALAKSAPDSMVAYLSFRGYSVEAAAKAFEDFAKNGFWRSQAGDQFGEPAPDVKTADTTPEAHV